MTSETHLTAPEIVVQPSQTDSNSSLSTPLLTPTREQRHLHTVDSTFISNSVNSHRTTIGSSSVIGDTVESDLHLHATMTSSGQRPLFIYLLTTMAAIGGFLFGYDTGVVSGAMIFLKQRFSLNIEWQELVVSITVGAAALFSLVSGFANYTIGRKSTILLASCVFGAGAFLLAISMNKLMLLAGRFIVGAGIGFASMTVPVYVAECAPADLRGRLVTINNLFITAGQFAAALVDGAFSYDQLYGWRWMLGLGAIPAVVQFVGFLIMPESPRFLVAHGQLARARIVLQTMRGTDNVEPELQQIAAACQAEQEARRQKGNRMLLIQVLRTPPVRRALFVGAGLHALQQLVGINTVMYYGATIIRMSGVQGVNTAVWLSSITAGVNFLFCIVGIVLVDRVGRKRLTVCSLIGVLLSLLLLSCGFWISTRNSAPVSFQEDLPPPTTTTAFMAITEKPASNSDWDFSVGTGDEEDYPCWTLNNCASCSANRVCGFCYISSTGSDTIEHSMASRGSTIVVDTPVNSSCLPADRLDPVAGSRWGRCQTLPRPPPSLNDSLPLFLHPATTPPLRSFPFADVTRPIWAYDYCPNRYTWMSILALVLYLACFAPGMGPMPWTINAEIYPLWARSFCVSFATGVNWMFNLLVSITFLSLAEALTTSGAFLIYAGFAAVALLFVCALLPETNGRTLEEMERIFDSPWPYFSCK